jgi:secreted PhoX family phosphatase
VTELYEQDDDVASNPSAHAHFAEVVATRLSRRAVLSGGMLSAAGFMTSRLVADLPAAYAAPKAGAGAGPAPLLGFSAVPLGFSDDVVVPAGYTATTFVPWGTPLTGSRPPFVPGSPDAAGTGNTAAEQEQQVGMHHDGMHYFPLGDGGKDLQRGLLVVNHEYTDESYLHTGTATRPAKESYTADMVRKSQAAHGVSVIEVERSPAGQWSVVPSRRNRRVTANTPMAFSGPVRGHRLVRTDADPVGTTPVGTLNNCAHGETPWDTYLTCEENFNGYFRVDPGAYDAEQVQLQSRYGVGGDRFNWATQDDRFVVTADDPREPNRFGWVLEIDPFAPGSTPVKRTALGRMKHEGAFVHVTKGQRVVVYMGDDQTNEYAYKFVSSANWRSLRARGISPLDSGTLYVARFGDDGSGTWLPLVHGQGPLTAANGFADQADVLVKTRLAADALGATPMDRPEWTSVDRRTGTVYLTLTNNTSSAKTVSAANPRKPNPWGHIVRWEEAGGDHAATSFRWDLFLLAGQGRDSGDGSTISEEDAFGSPDGLWLDDDSRVWIQTDGRQPGSANNQMLAADPYRTDSAGVPELRRFLTGPLGCEVTGVITTPDQRTMFVNIQHPTGTWPRHDGMDTPRSSTVIVTKDDGGVIGT